MMLLKHGVARRGIEPHRLGLEGQALQSSRRAVYNQKMPKYTTHVSNEALGTSRFVGTFEDEIVAQAYAQTEANRSRRFVRWEVWTGTPTSPGKPVGPIVRGTK